MAWSESPPKTGIECPKCGGFTLGCLITRRRPGRVIRIRGCGNHRCGHRVRTVERAEGHAKQKKKEGALDDLPAD